jgi:hypothetical protein
MGRSVVEMDVTGRRPQPRRYECARQRHGGASGHQRSPEMSATPGGEPGPCGAFTGYSSLVANKVASS